MEPKELLALRARQTPLVTGYIAVVFDYFHTGIYLLSHIELLEFSASPGSELHLVLVVLESDEA